MNLLTRVTIALFVILAVASLAITALKQRRFTQMQVLLSQKRFDELFEVLDSKLVRYLFPEYNREYLRLNAYLVKGDTKAAGRVLDGLLTQKASREQRIDLVIKALNIYVSEGKVKRAKAMLDEIESWDDKKLAPKQRECRQLYDVVLLKKTSHIREMEEELQTAKGARRSHLEYLLALQYEAEGDMERRNEHLGNVRG